MLHREVRFYPVYLSVPVNELSSLPNIKELVAKGYQYREFSRNNRYYGIFSGKSAGQPDRHPRSPESIKSIRDAIGLEDDILILMNPNFAIPPFRVNLLDGYGGSRLSLHYSFEGLRRTLDSSIRSYERRFGERPQIQIAQLIMERVDGFRLKTVTVDIEPLTYELYRREEGPTAELLLDSAPELNHEEFLLDASDRFSPDDRFNLLYGLINTSRYEGEFGLAVSKGGSKMGNTRYEDRLSYGAIWGQPADNFDDEVERVFNAAKVIADLFDPRRL